jgi:CRP/FNR family cyclic AMP-dependent transcriptional regulator
VFVFKRPLQSSSAHGTEVSRRYAAGELICREGETSPEMFVIQRGSVRIFKTVGGSELEKGGLAPAVEAASGSGELELALLHKGDFFGEMSLLEGLPRDASAQAAEPAEVLVMTPGALLVRLRRDPTFAFELLRRSSGRVRALNARLVALLAERGSARTWSTDALLYSSGLEASEPGRKSGAS